MRGSITLSLKLLAISTHVSIADDVLRMSGKSWGVEFIALVHRTYFFKMIELRTASMFAFSSSSDISFMCGMFSFQLLFNFSKRTEDDSFFRNDAHKANV